MGRRYCQRPQPGHMKKRRKEAWLSIRQGVSCFLLRFAENEKKFSHLRIVPAREPFMKRNDAPAGRAGPASRNIHRSHLNG
jgi:hypothetical protein